MANIKSWGFRILFIIAGIMVISGCNTVQGVGKDLQQGGQEIQKAATISSKSV